MRGTGGDAGLMWCALWLAFHWQAKKGARIGKAELLRVRKRGWNVKCHETTSYICRPLREVEPEVQRCQKLSEKEGATSLTDVEDTVDGGDAWHGECCIDNILWVGHEACPDIARMASTLGRSDESWAGSACFASKTLQATAGR